MNIKLKELTEKLGIKEYPEELNTVFDAFSLSDEKNRPLHVTETLTALHEEYDPFGGCYELLLDGARELEQDEALTAYLAFGFFRCRDAGEKEAAGFPLPPLDGSAAKNAFPAILLSLEFPETVKRYRARGFDEAQIKKYLGNLGINLRVHKLLQGVATLNQGLYGWMTHYTKAQIFDHMGFNFQHARWRDEAVLLRHRKSGELAFLMRKGKFTADGKVAGLRGHEEIPAAIEAVFEETEDAYFGYRAEGQSIRTEKARFSKNEWEAVLCEGDDIINFHIPRGADFTPSHVEQSIREGADLCARYYPECNFRYTVCTSWMLDPKLLDILPESSKMAHFLRHFVLHPGGDTSGTACLGYVWPGENVPIEELSETTSLQRGIKQMMLGGNFIDWTTGVWV